MRLDELRVIHLSKSWVTERPSPTEWVAPKDAFVLDSCQRVLWVGSEASFREGAKAAAGFEVFAGVDAYHFMLRVASGLESQISGETDIFGQLKEAWRNCETLSTELEFGLTPWMQRIFEDTKEIRSRFLQNLGSSTYGSLVRRILQDKTPAGPVILFGAGQIAQAVAPFLIDRELWLWNRSRANLLSLYDDLKSRPESNVSLIETPEDEARALKDAAHLVICIPVSPEQDERRIRLWKEGFRGARSAGRTVIHLGGLRGQCGAWEQVENFHSLNDLFELQKAHGEFRSAQIARSAHACLERAKLRSLGASVSIPHGWEDLAVFA